LEQVAEGFQALRQEPQVCGQTSLDDIAKLG